jgi:hypothetical protein
LPSPEPDERPAGRRRSSARELAIAVAQLAALSGLAVAQPVFDLLSGNAEFFAVRGSSGRDIVFFALVLALLPPLVLGGAEVVAGLVDRRIQVGLHLIFVAGFVALLAVQALKKADGLGSTAIIIGSCVAGLAAAAAYWRLPPVRTLLTVLSPAALFFLALFLFFSPVTKLIFPPQPQIARAAAGNRGDAPPVVFVIFDELPSTALMDDERQIDAVRFPNLASFAGSATWFRNVTTVHEETTGAVPAVLTGMLPKKGALPTFPDHPQNVFTLLARTYRLNADERLTQLCPQDVCENAGQQERFRTRMKSLFSDVGVLYGHIIAPPSYEDRLPSVTTGWGNFAGGDTSARSVLRGRDNVDEFRKFLGSIEDRRRPTFDFLHILLPHGPWVLLPSCASNLLKRASRLAPAESDRRGFWVKDQWLIEQSYQRLLLQMQCTDKLVGELVQRLKQTGLWQKALVVLASDHGVSVRPGLHRRAVDPANPGNLSDIAFSTLLVKRPGQDRGEILDRHVQTIDIVPTIAQTVGISIPWHVDGRSAFDSSDDPPRINLLTALGRITPEVAPLERERDEAVQRQIRMFGSGRSGPGFWHIGPHPELIGRRVASVPVATASGLTATVSGDVLALLADLARGATVLPTPVYGKLRGPGAEQRHALAVALNGKIAAMTWSEGSGSTDYSALVPEQAFVPGANRVEVFLVEERGAGLALSRLGGN